MKILTPILMAILFTSCVTKAEMIDDAKNNVSYFKDKNAGYCFAYIHAVSNKYEVSGLTKVPCLRPQQEIEIGEDEEEFDER